MGWISQLRRLFGHEDREIEDELTFHIAERAEELAATGLSEPEARRQAVIQFGGYQGPAMPSPVYGPAGGGHPGVRGQPCPAGSCAVADVGRPAGGWVPRRHR